MATQWPSRKAEGPLATSSLWPSGMLAAGLSDVWKESLTKCWIRCLSDSGVNSLLMGTMLSFRTRIALQGGRGKAQLCQRIAVHPKLLRNATVFQITPLQLHYCSRELCLPGLTVVKLTVRGMGGHSQVREITPHFETPARLSGLLHYHPKAVFRQL